MEASIVTGRACGVRYVVVGAVASLFGVAHTDGIDWIRWALSLVAAIVAISVYLGVTGRK